MFAAMLIAQITIITAGPTLSPTEAAAVLARLDSPANATQRFVCTDCDGPRVVVVRSAQPSRATPQVYPSLAAVPWATRAAVSWKHTAPAPYDPTIRTVRIIDDRSATSKK